MARRGRTHLSLAPSDHNSTVLPIVAVCQTVSYQHINNRDERNSLDLDWAHCLYCHGNRGTAPHSR